MLTRIEINGFKTFEDFSLNLRPFCAVVGPNASGKSNLFDAIKFLSLLAQNDIRTAMQDLRGEPDELFRRTENGTVDKMSFAVEVFLDSTGADAFGTKYALKSQRIRYEVSLDIKYDSNRFPSGIFVTKEHCRAIARKEDRLIFAKEARVLYSGRLNPFISMRESKDGGAVFEIRQDGPANETGTPKRGRPVSLPAIEASRTALSTITTAEFPHLYALKNFFISTRFLEINPQSARKASDRFELKQLRPDASNLAAVLARLKDETSSEKRPEGVIADISMDLASLIPSVRSVEVYTDRSAKEYSFGISTADKLEFSSRVISDGTLRLLALLAILDDPDRRGLLCFEEPENGVHEGRIASLISFLRNSAISLDELGHEPIFQILINTHSPAVMESLKNQEIIAADSVTVIDPRDRKKSNKTRMRTKIVEESSIPNPETDLTRAELKRLLRYKGDDF